MMELGHAEISSAETSSVRVWQTMYSRAFDVHEARRIWEGEPEIVEESAREGRVYAGT